MACYHLAQINIGRFRAEPDDPVNADFMAALDAVNAQAEAAEGFIWRLTGSGNNATDIQMFDDPLLLMNMSLWRDLASLHDFTYRTADHTALMARRAEWFTPVHPHLALWWVEAGHIPTPAEGVERLDMLARLGPSQDAFSFAQRFSAPQ